MYANHTSILNIGQDTNELQKPTSENTGLEEQYFETTYLQIQSKHTTFSSRQNNAGRRVN
jgi:hypothetical protein